MSISLNNHESRIKTLENKTSTSGYSETVIYNGTLSVSYNNNSNFTVTQDVSKFKMILVEYWHSSERNDGNKVTIIPFRSWAVLGNKIDIYQGGDGVSGLSRHLFLTKKDNVTFNAYAYDCNLKLYKLIGLNL